VRELKEHTSEVIRRVRENRETIDVTLRGEVVARLVPVSRTVDQEALQKVWDERAELVQAIGQHWPKGVSAVDAVAQERE
jgi:prevent-host-death family protein